jgi:hypothetical protein
VAVIIPDVKLISPATVSCAVATVVPIPTRSLTISTNILLSDSLSCFICHLKDFLVIYTSEPSLISITSSGSLEGIMGHVIPKGFDCDVISLSSHRMISILLCLEYLRSLHEYKVLQVL